jgi:dTDP-4-dehydrorhamnose 3,5-epimerase-like enzyme
MLQEFIIKMFTSVKDLKIIELPKIPDTRGNLSFFEGDKHIPFAIKRAYWIYDVPGGEIRGGHAFKEQNEFIIAISGSFDVVVKDEKETRKVSLNRSYFGLYIPRMIWRSLENFSTNSLALIVSDTEYSEDDYIRDINEYHTLRNAVL